MSVAARQLFEAEPPPHAFRSIEEYWESLAEDADGWRRELLDGAVIVTPPPGLPHQYVSSRLCRRLDDAAPHGLVVLEAIGVAVPGGIPIPDLVVMDRAAGPAVGGDL